jgi:DNA-binding CsgD family transcriptional regulator
LEVIDLAYQAATDPALWTPTLEGLADVAGGSAASLTWSERRRGAGGIAVRGGDEEAVQIYFEHFHANDPIQLGFDRMSISARAAQPVMTDRDCVQRGVLLAGEYFNDFMRRYDLGSQLMITGVAFTFEGAAPAFNVYRPVRADEFGASEIALAAILHKPLQRAYQMSRRLARQRRVDESLSGFVDQLAGAVFVVEGDGRLAHANAAGQAMLALRDGLGCEGLRLRASGAAAQRRLASLLATAGAPEPERRRGGALALPRPSGRRPLALLATPARSSGDLPGWSPLVLVSVVDPELGEQDPEARLRAYFGFTPAEARVAAELAAGYDAHEIAERLSRSVNTVRAQIARIREKTETGRQTELVALMVRALGVGGLRG